MTILLGADKILEIKKMDVEKVWYMQVLQRQGDNQPRL